MPVTENWLTCPLSIIQRLFESHPKNHDQKLKEYFVPRIESSQASGQLPSLNDVPMHNLATNSIVQFRGMIQDMHDPEFYLGAYEVENLKTGAKQLRSGKYRDVAECGTNEEIKLESDINIMMERQSYYCVPVPGESNWVKKIFAERSGSEHLQTSPSTSAAPEATKRPLDEGTGCSAGANGDGASMETENTTDMSQDAGGDKKKPKTQTTEDTSKTDVLDLNFPLPGERGPACFVKTYETGDDMFKLNDIVEIIGVLSNDPAMATFSGEKTEDKSSAFLNADSDMMEVLSEEETNVPPPSLVPRLHAISIRKLTHNNPLLPLSVVDTQDPKVQEILSEVQTLRTHLLKVFTELMFGDNLAAEYLLCHLISSVYARHDVIALGQYTLNISGCPRVGSMPTLIHGVVQELVAKCYFLPMSLDNMNKLRFSPAKDYKANKLKSGILQLSERTHLVLDETALQPGQLDINGVTNMTALGNVIQWQRVDYDFNFHKQEFSTNIIPLILSEGKSILKCDCQVPLVAGAGGFPQDLHEHFQKVLGQHLSSLDMMNKLRAYIGLVQILPYNLPAEVQKEIEQDFVETRKDNSSNMSVEDFHSLLVLARLLSLSCGQQTLSRENWEQAKVLEIQRKTRLVLTSTEHNNN